MRGMVTVLTKLDVVLWEGGLCVGQKACCVKVLMSSQLEPLYQVSKVPCCLALVTALSFDGCFLLFPPAPSLIPSLLPSSYLVFLCHHLPIGFYTKQC